MSRHLTDRFWICASVGFVSVLIAVAAKNLAPLAFATPFLWALVLSITEGWWPHLAVPEVELSTPRTIEGDEIELRVRIESARAVPWAEIELQLPAALTPNGPLRLVEHFRAGETTDRVFTMTAARWGVTGPEWLTVVTRDRYGITERVQHLAIANRLRVHPPTERLATLLPLADTRPVSGDHRSRRRGGGTELAEVRPYRTGDPIRQIHPALSARRGQPMVLERHPDESSDVVLFVDSVQDIGDDLDSSLRWTVTAAVALSQRHLRSMDRVGIIDRGAGVRWLPPKLGRRALHTITDALLSTAVLRPRGDDAATVPADHVPAGATVVALTPMLSVVIVQDLLALRRRGHEVIAIQPVTGDQQMIHPTDGRSARQASPAAQRIFRVTNEARRRQLTDHGIVVIPWDPAEPLEPTLRRMGRNIGRIRAAS